MASCALRSGGDYVLNRCVPGWRDCGGCVRPCDMGHKRTIRDVAKHAPNTCICTALRHDLYSAMGNGGTGVRIGVARRPLPSAIRIWREHRVDFRAWARGIGSRALGSPHHAASNAC